MSVLTSASGILSLLEEDSAELKVFALEKLNEVVGDFWAEIADQIQNIEIIAEDDAGKESGTGEIAALVASKVYFHLGEFDESVHYALGAGLKLDFEGVDEYTLTILEKCIDQYTAKRQAAEEVDARLEAVMVRVFERCMKAKQYRQTAGIALETRRQDILVRAINESGDINGMLAYCFECVMSLISDRKFRDEILVILSKLYSEQPTPDYMNITRCWIFLGETAPSAKLLRELLESGKVALAYQVSFDLYNNATQQFLKIVSSQLTPSGEEAEGGAAASSIDASVVQRVQDILAGIYTLEVYKEFLSRNNHSDELILSNTKEALSNNTVYHGALVMSNALMYAGTTKHPFLTKNVQWLRQAQNWAKFSSVASLGVVHKGHTAQAKHVLKPYLPGQETSAYVNGGAFYALGLIYANHGSGIIDYLMEQLRAAAGSQQAEVKEHGCCLGLGLAAMGTSNKEVFEMLNNKLGFNNAVVGEAAAIGMGLTMLGSGDEEVFANMCEYAAETQHEKIIRGIAVGSALLFYGQQGQAATPIEKLCSDEDPIMRMAGCHTIATAYAGVNDNAMIKKLLHITVSDVNDDVRRSAVTALGFVLCRNSEQLPSTVMLLSESFNPHVRYGTCMALGIACAGTGSPEAIGLLEPLVKDPVGYVRQSAFIALALVMMQQTNDHPKSKWIREELAKTVGDKHQDILSKFGAIYAQGILEAGGRNVTARLVNAEGHVRMQAVVGMLLFTQFWFWFPLGHCLSLALTPTAVVCVNENLQMPTSIKLKSNAPPSKFEYPPMIKVKEEKSKEKVEKAVLSTTAKAKAADAKKEKESDTDAEAAPMEVDAKPEEDKKEGEAAAADGEAAAKPDEPEASFCMLANPARVVTAQIANVTFEVDGRYNPVIAGPLRSGIIVVTNERPDEPEDVIKIEAPVEEAPAEEADMPAPFEFKLADEGEDDGN